MQSHYLVCASNISFTKDCCFLVYLFTLQVCLNCFQHQLKCILNLTFFIPIGFDFFDFFCIFTFRVFFLVYLLFLFVFFVVVVFFTLCFLVNFFSPIFSFWVVDPSLVSYCFPFLSLFQKLSLRKPSSFSFSRVAAINIWE